MGREVQRIEENQMAAETRDPASLAKVGSEVALFTPLGMLVAYFITKLDPTMPPEIQQAVVGVVIALGTMGMSGLRNRKHEASG